MGRRGGGAGAAGAGMGGEAGISSSALGAGAGAGEAGAAVPGSQKDLEVNVGDRVFFPFDSSSLDAKAQETLDHQAAWLLQFPSLTVTVEGNADERGTREYNLALGERRANAVKSYLVAKGVPDSRILTISYGSERPADPGHNETAWALNRRAVTVVNVTS
jgi:peptidoglycan-associated lipoprotein